MAALARLTGELATQRQEAGGVIAVLAPSGGSGSSTLAVNIATVLAKEHKTAALVDLKLEAGDLAALLDLKPTYTLADLCQNVARMDRVMFERSLVAARQRGPPAGPAAQLADIAHVTPEGVRQALDLARSCSPTSWSTSTTRSATSRSRCSARPTSILLVLRLDFASLRNARRTLDYLEQLGVGRDRVRLVVNRYGQPKEVPAAKAEEALGLKISHYVPDDPKTVNRANNNGVPVVLESPSAKVSKSVTQAGHQRQRPAQEVQPHPSRRTPTQTTSRNGTMT